MNKLVALILGFALIGCAEDGAHKPLPAEAGGGAQKLGGGAPGFGEVQAVFVKNCNACHPSKQPSDWMNYETSKAAATNGMLMRRVVTQKDMPQKGSAQDSSMTGGERDLIARWIKAGAPKNAVAASTKPVAGDGPGSSEGAPADPRYAAIQSCVGCHGTPPAGPSDATIPRLNGQNFEYLLRRLTTFKHSDPWDQSSPMNKIAFALTGDEIRATAQAFAGAGAMNDQFPEVASTRQSLLERGQSLAKEQCVMCHLSVEHGGRTNDALIPALAGQNEEYLKGQLYAFRSGARRSKGMNEYAAPLSDYDIDALALFFAATRHHP